MADIDKSTVMHKYKIKYPSKTVYLSFWLMGAIIGILFSSTVYWIITHNPFYKISNECIGINEFDEIYDTCKTIWSETRRLLFLFGLMFLPWLTTSLLACHLTLTNNYRNILLLLLCAAITTYLPTLPLMLENNIVDVLAIITLLGGIPILINLTILFAFIIVSLPELTDTI